MVALLFPGQGSQYVGMGRDLVAASPAARAVFEEADDVLGMPLSRICFEGPETDLVATANAQPAILVHSIAVHRAIRDQLGDVSFAAGHSLGEFSALVAAGALAFAGALRTVRRRGELMLRSGERRPGTMAAILGLDDAAVDAVCRDASAGGVICVAANYNAPGQVVVSGDPAAVERAIVLARDAGARRALHLNVSGAFHSPLMGEAESGLKAQLDAIDLRAPAFPIISNVTGSAVSDPAEARRLLIAQLTAPVRWADSMRTLLAAGVTRFVELGPGNVLSGLLRRIDRAAEAVAVGRAVDLAGLGETV